MSPTFNDDSDDDEFDLGSSDEFAFDSFNEFDLDSSDEADLIALADAVTDSQGAKRKASFDDEKFRPKRRAIETIEPHPLAVKALTETFGLESFRLKQKQVISRILAGQSVVVVFPTGGGKSLCYQIPALVFSELDKLTGARDENESGITLVVSPLIALMKDQVDALVRRGVRAAVMDSTKTREEYLQTCEMLRSGELKLLYCAPERLNNEGFVGQLSQVRGGIRLLAIDEAHCISQWGHAFRPDYLKISRFVTEIKAKNVVCLTATATPLVAKDICDSFGIDEACLFRTSTYRPNLRLLAESAFKKQELYPKMFNFLRSSPGASIVYVTLQKQTELLASDLRDQGFNSKAFHAGMESMAKAKLQEEFMDSDDLIIVATIAFGMGIDKASIRNVVHFNIPSSLESYSQEIGRAGRDGKSSNCVFYICGDDLQLREVFTRGDLPSRESVSGLLHEVFDPQNIQLPVGGEFRAAHFAQEKEFDIRATTLKNIYARLELDHGLIRATTPIYAKYSFKPGASYSSAILSDKSSSAKAIKLYAKGAKTLYHLEVETAAAKLGIPRTDIIHKLNEWDERGVIDLKPGGVLNVYKILKPLPKTPVEIEKLVEEIYCEIEKREQEAMGRIEDMVGLITGKFCFSRSLALHFGDDLPDGKTECGHCMWCLTHSSIVERRLPPVPFNNQAFESVLAEVKGRDDARFLARVAFGISSPRTLALKLSQKPVFGSMGDHDFTELLHAFTVVCRTSNRRS